MTKTITVDGDKFELPSAEEVGIVAGYILDDISARHLYQARCEHIRNNITGTVKNMKKQGISAGQITAWVTDYARKYQFSVPGGKPTDASRPKELEDEQYTIANEQIVRYLADQGRTIDAVPDGMSQDAWNEKLRENIERVARHPDTLKLAKRRLADRRKTAVLEGVSL